MRNKKSHQIKIPIRDFRNPKIILTPKTLGVIDILAERQKTHGEFRTHAAIAQALKATMCNRFSGQWQKLSNSQREALEMIQHKVARILNGNQNHKDHWDDIAGYATLVARELK